MKVEEFLNSIEEFFRTNKKEISKLQDALKKLEEKRAKLLKKLKGKDFLAQSTLAQKEDDKQSLRNKLSMVKELKKKIEKKIEKELNKLKEKNTK